MNVKIKRVHPDSVVPTYAKSGDAGMDLTCIKISYDDKDGCIVYDTGIQMEIPEGHVGLLFPRSSLSKVDLILTNHVGVIDSGYRGNIMFKFKADHDYWSAATDTEIFEEDLDFGLFGFYETKDHEHFGHVVESSCYAIGDRIGQILIMPYPQITFEEVEELSSTERGAGGYGSTGS